MTYVIAEQSFPTKEAVTNRAREALARTPHGQPVNEFDSEFLLALFQYHDEWDEKSAGGVRDITTKTTIHGSPCFVLRKQNGTEVDISFPHAIRLMPSTRKTDLLPQKLRDFRNAARAAVCSQIYEFRDEALRQSSQCPISGEQLTRSNAAVDHIAPQTFDELVFRFCHEQRINPLEVRIGSQEGVVAVFEDTALSGRWQDFHKLHARLRLISRVGNLKLPKSSLQWASLWS